MSSSSLNFRHTLSILGDPGADSGGERKSKRAGKYGMKKRKEKNGEKSPWGKCLTRPVPNCRGHSGFWSVPENFCVFLPNRKAERQQPFRTGLVRHCPQGLFSPFFSFLRAIFSRPFRLSLAPTICPWVSEDGQHSQCHGFWEKSFWNEMWPCWMKWKLFNGEC